MSKILFLANHFITLYSFRKELIQKLVSDGHDVYLSLPVDADCKYFAELGCNLIDTPIDRRGVNPFKDLKLVRFYKKIMKKIKPDIIFSYTIKPNIYGAFASNKIGIKQVCNITGTGGTFLKDNLLSKICIFLYRKSIKKSYKVFFQNSGDRDFFVSKKMVNNNYDLLPGSGCNLSEHAYYKMEKRDVIKFIFIGRVMKLKGIDEYLYCAKTIKDKYKNVEFLIAGWNEEESYKKVVQSYQDDGIVNYIGFRKDISEWIKKVDCVVLPSHGGEGIPNVLLESAATGRVCIGSNINGTKDVIEDGVNGFLFEQGNSFDLIEKVEKFLSLSFIEREKMGLEGRKRVERYFSREIVIKKYIDEVNNE